MELEFELRPKDLLKKHKAISKQNIRFGFWAIVLLVVCSLVQAIFLWFCDVMFGMPKPEPIIQFMVLVGLVTFNFFVVIRYRRMARFPSLNTRIEFHDEYIYERAKNTEYQKAYACLDQVEEEKDYFILRHPGNLIVIPKRVLNEEQRRWIVEELPGRISNTPETTVPFYEQSFDQNREDSFHFEWREEDFANLNVTAFTPYDSGTALKLVEKKKQVVLSARLVMRLIFIPVAAILILYSILESSLLFSPAIVFLVGFLLLNELSYMQQERAKRLQTEALVGRKSEFFVSSQEVWIGQPSIVNRHALSDIVSLCYSDYFVALQSQDRLLYILPKRAIGSDERVIEFLENVHSSLRGLEPVETGNPYQSPTL